MTGLLDDIKAMAHLREAQGGKWSAIKPEYAARMRAQNRFHTGLDIARYTAKIMRDDMAAYDADTSQYTQSLGCWHGFIGPVSADTSPRSSTPLCTTRRFWISPFAPLLFSLLSSY